MIFLKGWERQDHQNGFCNELVRTVYTGRGRSLVVRQMATGVTSIKQVCLNSTDIAELWEFPLHSAFNYVSMTSKVILINKPTGVKEFL